MMKWWLITDSGSSNGSTFIFFRDVEVLLKAVTSILRGSQRQLLGSYMGSLVTVSSFMILYICHMSYVDIAE